MSLSPIIHPVIVQLAHYDPWGLELTGLGYQYGGIKANKYLYNGKELIEDNGLQNYDYGQRMYDPAIGRFNRIDRFSEKYSSLSPYQYGANNPISNIDINGDSIVNNNRAVIESIVNDLNRIFESTYGTSGFSTHERSKTEKTRTNDWSLLDPSSWGNIFKSAEYDLVTTTDYAISLNEDFDWNQDKYTSGMKDVVSGSGDVYVDIVQDNGSKFKNSVPKGMDGKGLLNGFGGGYTVSSNNVILSNKLPNTDNRNKTNTWTIGAVTLHEILYHIHTVGKTESGNPNKMREHFGLKRGRSHGPGSRQKY